MHMRLVLVSVAATLGCASAPNADRGPASLWPRGTEPHSTAVGGVTFGQPGTVSFYSRSPRYVLFLELRPTLDSLEVRASNNVSPYVALAGKTDLTTSMLTVDALEVANVSAQFNDCSTVKMGAGDTNGQQVCPVSRSYSQDVSRKWRFRNRVFLLVSDQPFPTPLPPAIPWATRYTTPPVVRGSKWTAFEL